MALQVLDRWSAKDADGVAALLAEDAVLIGPLAPDGRIQGAASIRDFLNAQNRDRDRFPIAVRSKHEAISRSVAKIRRALVQDSSVAIEATLVQADGDVGQEVAVFIDVAPDGRGVRSVTVYFMA